MCDPVHLLQPSKYAPAESISASLIYLYITFKFPELVLETGEVFYLTQAVRNKTGSDHNQTAK